MMIRTLALLLGVAATVGCNGVECGEGTFASGKDCVGFDPSDKTAPVTMVSPPGGRTRDPLPELVTLTTDEPAKIFFTTDGTDPDPAAGSGETSPVTVVDITQGMTIKFIAVDAAGNREAPASATFDSDATAPAPVTGMAVVMTGTTANVTWTNPTDADYAGTVVARVGDVVDVAPTPGQMIASATMLSPSVQVTSVGTTTQFADAGRAPGPVRYVAWTFDDLGNYSAPVAALTEVPLGGLTAALTFTTAGSTLAVTQAPDHLDLSASTATLVGTTLTVTLSVTNKTTRFFQNPKAEVTATTNATFGNSDGTADTFPFRTLGPAMLAPGATVTRDLTFTGVAAGTATIDLTFAHHPTMLANARNNQQTLIDLGSGRLLPALVLTGRGPNDRVGGRVRPGLLVGGRYLDLPSTHGQVERFDLVTQMRIGGAPISIGDKANVQSLVTTGAEMIAVVKRAGRRDSGDAELVRVDEGQRVTGRLVLPYTDEQGFGRPGLSADRATLAIPLSGGILLVDARTMTLIDPSPATPLVELVPTGLTGRARSVVFFNGTDGMLVVSRTGGQASILKRTAAGYTSTLYQDTNTTAKGFSAALAPDGRIWMAFSSGIRAFDPATSTVSPVTYASAPQGLSVVDGQMWIIRSDRLTLDRVSNTGAVQQTISLPAANAVYGHWLEAAR
ncbi:MAG: Ig domain protein group 2 domain protein [Deltaproteobacteria bacterium]|nr:Ig domain protein group 2 domain protein [Deltaproteobacteria bacterium]